MKKLLLTLGTIAAVVAPVASVVACGSSSNAIDITKGQGKEIADTIENEPYVFSSYIGDVKGIKTNFDLDKDFDIKKENYMQITGANGTLKMVFAKNTGTPSILYKSKNDKELKAVHKGDTDYANLMQGVADVARNMQ